MDHITLGTIVVSDFDDEHQPEVYLESSWADLEALCRAIRRGDEFTIGTVDGSVAGRVVVSADLEWAPPQGVLVQSNTVQSLVTRGVGGEFRLDLRATPANLDDFASSVEDLLAMAPGAHVHIETYTSDGARYGAFPSFVFGLA